MIIADKKAELLLTSNKLNKNDVKFLIKYCKSLVETRSKIKWKVVEIALRVCDDVKGGHVTGTDYTYFQFARDIGIKEKTLWRWKKEYQILYSKVPEKDLKDLKRKQIEQILGKADKSTPKSKIKELILEQKKVSEEERVSSEYMYRLSNIHFFYTKKICLSAIPASHLERLKVFATELLSAIESFEKGAPSKKVIRRRKRTKALKALGA